MDAGIRLAEAIHYLRRKGTFRITICFAVDQGEPLICGIFWVDSVGRTVHLRTAIRADLKRYLFKAVFRIFRNHPEICGSSMTSDWLMCTLNNENQSSSEQVFDSSLFAPEGKWKK